MKLRTTMLILVCASTVVAGCTGSDGDDAQAADEPGTTVTVTDPEVVTDPAVTTVAVTQPATTAPATTAAVTTAPGTTDVEPTPKPSDTPREGPWQVAPVEDCVCSDGSALDIYERIADPTKVVLYFEGGGACFNEATCDPNGNPTYTVNRASLSAEEIEGFGGYFDFGNAENPLASHSWIYVPYCTGDVHIGNTTHDYGNGVVIEHRGHANATRALDYLAATFPDAEQIVVTGQSAGSVPTAQFAGLAADRFPDADIVTFGDSSGAYPDVDGVNSLVGAVWGTTEAMPDWPETVGVEPSGWSFPEQYAIAGQHAPQIRFGRFDYAFDEVQAAYGALAGVAAADLVSLIDETEAQIEAAGVEVATYVAAGRRHVVSGDDTFYEMAVGGVRLVDWLRDLIEGPDAPADVHCETCS